MLAIDMLTVKIKQKFNIRFTMPMNDNGKVDNLDLTQRRREKSNLDWKYRRPILLNPSVTAAGDIRAETRIFTKSGSEDLNLARRHPPSGRVEAEEVIVHTDGSAINNGTPTATAGAGIWSDHKDLVKALQVQGEPQINNRGELAAVAWALAYAPKDTPLLIKSDSTYVIHGLHTTHHTWEDQGWLGVENSDLWKIALQEMRTRRAKTRIAKVKAHSNIHGNDQADRLAKEGTFAMP